MELNTIHKIYFIGIGGIGMSALARYFNGRGVQVYGYDKVETTLTKTLVREGIDIHYEETIEAIPEGIDLVVYTPAIPNEHKELIWFQQNGFSIKKRAEVLGIISRSMKTIAIAGTHGKTTTSSILAHLLQVGGIDCTAFLGGIAMNFKSNFVEGSSDWVVVEADEFDRSFLHLSPTISVVLSMDADHLDIYGDDESVKEGFEKFVAQTQSTGRIFYQKDLRFKQQEKRTKKLMESGRFGIGTTNNSAQNIRVEEGYFVFDYEDIYGRLESLKFTLPGQHNVSNATVAIAIARYLGVEDEKLVEALASFKGIKRRFEFIVRKKEKIYIDDYAHHPTELKAAILAARTLYPAKKITGIFQPHLYSRTRDFAEGFAEALDGLDEVILMDIYPARELPIEGVSSKIIFEKMKNTNCQLASKETLMEKVKKLDIEVVLTLGAGDIDLFVQPIKEMLESKR